MEVQIKEVETTPAGYKSISESLEKRNAELKQLEEQLVERRAEPVLPQHRLPPARDIEGQRAAVGRGEGAGGHDTSSSSACKAAPDAAASLCSKPCATTAWS